MPEKMLYLRRLVDRDVLLHLRLPFSFFLLPVFCMAVSQTAHYDISNLLVLFVVLHLLIYPASNIYNSYMDKDKGSIGGLEKPPPVSKKMYYTSIVLDGSALLLAMMISVELALLLVPYIAASKAYSWHGIRLKKRPIISWLIVMLFQGGYTFMVVNMFAGNDLLLSNWFTLKNINGGLIAALLIGGFYPLTQIFQHREDEERGDKTISYLLGIRGTFFFSAIMFLVAGTLLSFYFDKFYQPLHFYLLLITASPAVVYFIYWMVIAFRDPVEASYWHCMRMNYISSSCLVIGFCLLFWMNYGG